MTPDQAAKIRLMQWIAFKMYITTVYQFTLGITSSLDRLCFTFNPKWLYSNVL